MKQNLDSLKEEIEAYLHEEGLTIFHGYSRVLDTAPTIFWDTDSEPDYKDFVAAAKSVGTQLMVLHHQEFSSDEIEHALEGLEDSEMPLEEYRKIERRFSEMQAYDGFTCSLELSFDYGSRIYIFDLRTEWYDEFTDLLDELQMLTGSITENEEDDDTPMSGYFSKN